MKAIRLRHFRTDSSLTWHGQTETLRDWLIIDMTRSDWDTSGMTHHWHDKVRLRHFRTDSSLTWYGQTETLQGSMTHHWHGMVRLRHFRNDSSLTWHDQTETLQESMNHHWHGMIKLRHFRDQWLIIDMVCGQAEILNRIDSTLPWHNKVQDWLHRTDSTLTWHEVRLRY